MTILDIYIIVSAIMLVAFGIVLKMPHSAPIWPLLWKVLINLTAVLGLALLMTRLGLIG